MTHVATPDRSKGLPDEMFPLDAAGEPGEETAIAVAAPAWAARGISEQGLTLPNGDPPTWMLWGVEE